MEGLTVTALKDRKVRLDGDFDVLYQAVMQMRTDGRLERIVTAPAPRDDGLHSVVVLLQSALPPGKPPGSPPVAESSPESPPPQSPRPTPSVVRSEGTRRALALAGLILGGCGLVIGACLAITWGVVWAASWIGAHLLPVLPTALAVLLIVGLALRLSGPSTPKAAAVPLGVPEPVTVKKSKVTGRVIEDSEVVGETNTGEPVRMEQRYHWLTGRPLEQRIRVGKQALASKDSDDLTERWLAAMKDPDSGQAIGRWSGGHYDLMADSMYGGSIETAINMHYDDRCAVSWLQHLADPKDRRYGKKHSSWRKINEKYGRAFVKDVIRMNDSGMSLRRIAKKIEPKLRKQGHIR
jgi:hypothetical protein